MISLHCSIDNVESVDVAGIFKIVHVAIISAGSMLNASESSLILNLAI